MTISKSGLAMLAATGLGFTGGAAVAGQTFYTSESDFHLATSTNIFEGFERASLQSSTTAIYPNARVTCSVSCLSYINSFPDEGVADIGANDSTSGVTFHFYHPVTAAGIDIIGAGTVDSTDISVSTPDGSTVLYPLFHNIFFNNVLFAGVIDTLPFTSLTITGTNPFDYVEFDRLQATGVPTVPEPASWALLIIGVFGAGAVLRRRRAAAPTMRAATRV